MILPLCGTPHGMVYSLRHSEFRSINCSADRMTSMTTPIGKVFVSHASADKVFVDRLVSDLAVREIPVWYDKLDLRVGDSVTGGINDGLASSKYFLIVLSKSSVG